MNCPKCGGEMVVKRRYPPADRGIFRGQETMAWKCENSKHRYTVYGIEIAEPVEVPATRRGRAAELLQRAEALASR